VRLGATFKGNYQTIDIKIASQRSRVYLLRFERNNRFFLKVLTSKEARQVRINFDSITDKDLCTSNAKSFCSTEKGIVPKF
jgi:hypothetical protein